MDIPVIPVSEATLKFATLLGQRIGVVTLYEPYWVIHYRELLRKYGLEAFCIDKDPVRSVDLTTNDAASKGMKEPKIIVEAVRRKAEELAEDGAEAIQVGCGMFSPICTMAGLSSVKDGRVPLLDPLLVGLKTAEMMVTFHQTLGMPFRRGLNAYNPIPMDDLNRIRRSFNLPPV